MKRRAVLPGQLSLFQAPAPTPVPAAPAAAPQPADPGVPLTWATVPQPEYFRDGRFWLPPGIRPDMACKHWFCVCHPDGSYRDAVAILYVMRGNDAQPVSLVDIPVIGRRYELRDNWRADVFEPSMRALQARAAEVLGLTVPEVRQLAYVTQAWSGEVRPELRDVPHLGNTCPRSLSKAVAA